MNAPTRLLSRKRVQVQISNNISDNYFSGRVKVRLEKRRPLHAKTQVVLVVAEELIKVRLER